MAVIPFVDHETEMRGDIALIEGELNRVIAEHDRVWVVVSHEDDQTIRLLSKFETGWEMLDHRKYFSVSHIRRRPYLGVEVMLFGRSPTA